MAKQVDWQRSMYEGLTPEQVAALTKRQSAIATSKGGDYLNMPTDVSRQIQAAGSPAAKAQQRQQMGAGGISTITGGITSAIAGGLNMFSELSQEQFDREKLNKWLGGWEQFGPALLGDIEKEYGGTQRYLQEIQRGDLASSRGMYDYLEGATKGYGAGERQYIDEFGRAMRGELSSRANLLSGEAGKSRAELLGQLGGRYTEAMGMLEGAGAQERKDIQRAYGEQQKGIEANLAQRGMGGTTIGATMGYGTKREETDALGRLEERLRGQKLGVHQAYTGDIAGATERLGSRDLALMEGLSGEWTNLTGQLQGDIMGSRRTELGSLYGLGADRRQDETDIWRNAMERELATGQGYNQMRRGAASGIMDTWSSGLLASDVRFPSYAGLDAAGSAMTGIGSYFTQQKALAAERNKKSGLFGMGGGAGAGIGAAAGLGIGLATGGVGLAAPISTMGFLAGGAGAGYLGDRAFFG